MLCASSGVERNRHTGRPGDVQFMELVGVGLVAMLALHHLLNAVDGRQAYRATKSYAIQIVSSDFDFCYEPPNRACSA